MLRLHAPEIVFLFAVMLAEGIRSGGRAYSGGDVSWKRLTISAGKGGGLCQRHSGRGGGRKLLALRWIAVRILRHRAGYVVDQFEQVTVLHALDTVGKNYELAINFVEFAALEIVSELLAAQSQRVTAGVFAQHEAGIGTPTDCGVMIS